MTERDRNVEEERRAIRRNQRDLLELINRTGSDLTNPNSDGLNEVMRDGQKLFDAVTQLENVAATSETVLDAQILSRVSCLTVQRAKKVHVDDKFDPNVFMEKLRTFMGGRRMDNARPMDIEEAGWSRLGNQVSTCFKRASALHFMGTYEIEAPKKRVVNRNKKAEEPAGPAVVPVQVKSTGKRQEEVTNKVERMVGILRQVTQGDADPDDYVPISYFEFVIDPHSFSHTVENIFHLSFVLKDGHAEIKLDEDGLPVIIPAKPHMEERSGSRILRKQVLVSIDVEQWKKLIEAFEITEALIPSEEQNGHV
ncbi:EP300-interacting inhibitor of differentiation 3-like [Diadema antillarum]|uniref:EP300-interacting inhibitor of differentiation 3-like n=1 Tax=Diadema antillarum TaxID=105358 RepID=UPI003A866F5C